MVFSRKVNLAGAKMQPTDCVVNNRMLKAGKHFQISLIPHASNFFGRHSSLTDSVAVVF
jgi:hypothetical protein